MRKTIFTCLVIIIFLLSGCDNKEEAEFVVELDESTNFNPIDNTTVDDLETVIAGIDQLVEVVSSEVESVPMSIPTLRDKEYTRESFASYDERGDYLLTYDYSEFFYLDSVVNRYLSYIDDCPEFTEGILCEINGGIQISIVYENDQVRFDVYELAEDANRLVHVLLFFGLIDEDLTLDEIQYIYDTDVQELTSVEKVYTVLGKEQERVYIQYSGCFSYSYVNHIEKEYYEVFNNATIHRTFYDNESETIYSLDGDNPSIYFLNNGAITFYTNVTNDTYYLNWNLLEIDGWDELVESTVDTIMFLKPYVVKKDGEMLCPETSVFVDTAGYGTANMSFEVSVDQISDEIISLSMCQLQSNHTLTEVNELLDSVDNKLTTSLNELNLSLEFNDSLGRLENSIKYFDNIEEIALIIIALSQNQNN